MGVTVGVGLGVIVGVMVGVEVPVAVGRGVCVRVGDGTAVAVGGKVGVAGAWAGAQAVRTTTMNRIKIWLLRVYIIILFHKRPI